MTQRNEYKTIYVQESDDLLQQMNKSLLILENNLQNTGALNAIFRAAHTLKSMAASMGYSPISELAHKMEDLLSQLRSGLNKASPEVVDILFRAFDALESMSGFVQQDKEIISDASSLIAALDNFIIKATQVQQKKAEVELVLDLLDKRTLLRAKKEGYYCFNIDIELDKKCILKSARAIMVFKNLHGIGEVIKSYPDSQSIEEEEFGLKFSCILVTKESRKTVEKKVSEFLEISKAIVKELDIPQSWEEEVSKEKEADLLQRDTVAAGGPTGADEGLQKILSVRVGIKRLDKIMNLVEELIICKLRLTTVAQKDADIELKAVIEELNRLADELQFEVMQARLVPVGQIFNRFPRLIRDLAKNEGKLVKFDVGGADIELDRIVLDEIGYPLIHLLRNAVAHGIELPRERKAAGKPEEGYIMLLARREKNHVFIEVKDDGRGIDAQEIKKAALKHGIATQAALDAMAEEEILLLAAKPALTTKEEVTEVSGRGVGLDVAKQTAESLGGSLFIETKAGEGTKISLRLPITTAIVNALLVSAGKGIFAISISGIKEIVSIKSSDLKTIEGKEAIMHRNRVLPIARLNRLFQSSVVKIDDSQKTIDDSNKPSTCDYNLTTDESAIDRRLNIVIVEPGKIEFGIVIDRLIGQHDIVIKQLSKELRGVKGFAGATILGDGNVALVLDLASLI